MKRRYIVFIFVLVLTLLLSTGCKCNKPGGGTSNPPKPVYDLQLSQSTITLKLSEVATYDFKSLFTLKLNDEIIEIKDNYVTSNVIQHVGEYTYNVSIDNQTKTLTVKVVEDPIEVIVTSTKKSITIKDTELNNYDFKSLFEITVNGDKIEVLDEYLNLKTNDFTPGKNTLICTYNFVQAEVTVEIIETIYEIELSVTEITINQSLAKSYDYKSLFTFKIDGKISKITDDMIENNVIENEGTYTYIVSIHGIHKTLTVNITNDHAIEIIKSYNEIEIPIDAVEEYDYTMLFSVYVDGRIVQVTNDMIDTSNLNSVVVNQTYDISLTYKDDKTEKTESINVKIIEETQIIINAKHVIIYPNSEHIDLTTLFTISKGTKNIEVTSDMITGGIDYDNNGINEIKINYQNIEKIAIVEVRSGVIIETPQTDTITIIKGTNQQNYSFVSDFKVIINGIHFDSIPDTYISLNNADFSQTGEYAVTLRIPYNDKRLGLSGVKFEYYEKTIIYKVVENKYAINLNNELVTLPIGTKEYNVYQNLNVIINNKRQALTEIKEYVDPITCYAKIISNPIDFTIVGLQKVAIEVYVNGVESSPVLVEYNLIIESNIKIINSDIIAFTGDTIYARDLFKISNETEEIEVTSDMITGKIDTFKPGVYFVTINYMGITETSRVVVYDSSIKGIYHTDFTTIPEKEEEDYSEGSYGEYDSETYSIKKAKTVVPYDDLIITDDGQIILNKKDLKIIKGIDEETMLVEYYNYEYTLSINNGIITLNPDNSIKLAFNDYKRPLIYFSEDLWQIDSKVIINSSSSHILEVIYTGYSIDIFNVTSKLDGSKLSFGVMISLVEKTSADTVYVVVFSETQFDDNFKMEIGNTSSLIFNSNIYKFTMTSSNVGKTRTQDENKKYANMTFTGLIDGKSSELKADKNEALSLYIEGKLICSFAVMELENLKNGGVDYATNTIFLYGYEDQVFSYKFIVDPSSKTFELVEKDNYFGKYIYNDKMIYIDGYGTGLINFNTTSYYVTRFNYSVSNNYMTIKYIDTLPSFKYGTSGKFYISPLLNQLTVKDLGDPLLKEVKFENIFVVDGAIVRINTLKIGQNSDSIAKNELFDNIEIITSSGVLDKEAKASCINTTAIKFNTPGFYKFSITLSVNNEEVVSNYAIQIIESIYKDNPIVGVYGSGVIYNTNTLMIDQYGQIALESSGTRYSGMVKINNDLTFSAKLASDKGASITLVGKSLVDGIITLQCSGAISVNDYFTKGTSYVSGTKGFILRLIIVGSNNTFILSSNESIMGEIVEVVSINGVNPTSIGALLEINVTNKKYVRINSWNDIKQGLDVADEFRGTYTSPNGETLTIDGFGGAIIDDTTGTYTINKQVATITTLATTKVYRLDNINFTYEEVEIVLDNSLVNGKIFNASYQYVCSSYIYAASTTFVFENNGVVTIRSISPSHDDGEDACTEDKYDPIFASSIGVKGTYSVSGNKLTIKVNNITFVFVIDNVLIADTITCVSTTLDSEEHGYFSVNTMFMSN